MEKLFEFKKNKKMKGNIGAIEDRSSKSSSKKKKNGKGFKNKNEYYVPLTEVIRQLGRKKKNRNDMDRPILLASEFARIRPGKKISVEYHDDVKAKYLACVVNERFEFDMLDKRKIDKVREDGNNIYFIPLHFIQSLASIPDKNSDLNLGEELASVSIFKYTGEIEIFRNLSIFSLATSLYLTNKPKASDNKINVIY